MAPARLVVLLPIAQVDKPAKWGPVRVLRVKKTAMALAKLAVLLPTVQVEKPVRWVLVCVLLGKPIAMEHASTSTPLYKTVVLVALLVQAARPVKRELARVLQGKPIAMEHVSTSILTHRIAVLVEVLALQVFDVRLQDASLTCCKPVRVMVIHAQSSITTRSGVGARAAKGSWAMARGHLFLGRLLPRSIWERGVPQSRLLRVIIIRVLSLTTTRSSVGERTMRDNWEMEPV
tara:strand:+ start:3916 stop:4614 length:699 start_codon:yes stop_codon:yes gene_type:complete